MFCGCLSWHSIDLTKWFLKFQCRLCQKPLKDFFYILIKTQVITFSKNIRSAVIRDDMKYYVGK